MTTIYYDGKKMACDSRVTFLDVKGGVVVEQDEYCKIHQPQHLTWGEEKVTMVGYAGDTRLGLALITFDEDASNSGNLAEMIVPFKHCGMEYTSALLIVTSACTRTLTYTLQADGTMVPSLDVYAPTEHVVVGSGAAVVQAMMDNGAWKREWLKTLQACKVVVMVMMLDTWSNGPVHEFDGTTLKTHTKHVDFINDSRAIFKACIDPDLQDGFDTPRYLRELEALKQQFEASIKLAA